jgi:peptide-methionine (S)-S-oxide reductase
MNIEKAVLGGGCFWCTEAVFKMLKGVSVVKPGYAGGTKLNPTYMEVSSGDTGYAEVVYIEFDPTVIEYKKLLTVFFASHDPTTLNQQGADIGTQYRSVIFYTTDGQRKDAEDFIADLNASAKEGEPITTEISPLTNYYDAEDYHHDYYANNKNAMYCQVVINPKLQKVQEKFAELLKNNKIINNL